jgi:hypothetical protein
MLLVLDNWVISRLSEPFSEEELHWRPGGGGSFLAYIDARQVVERLNYVVGPVNWYDSYTPITIVDTEVKDVTNLDKIKKSISDKGGKLSDYFWTNKNGDITGLKDKSLAEYEYRDFSYSGIRCSLQVLGVERQDVGTTSPADKLKGAHSDALKRAAVKFGIGSYLYSLKNLRGGIVEKNIVVEPPRLPDWALPQKRGNPDEAILSLIEKIKSFEGKLLRLENIFKNISVMGSYDHSAPLVVKRYVYEELKSLLESKE